MAKKTVKTEGRATPPVKERRAARKTAPSAVPVAPERTRKKASSTLAIAGELRRLSGSLIDLAGSAADFSLSAAQAAARGPRQRAAVRTAGEWLRRARETAGLTTRELSRAIDLSDVELLERAETGAVALPFEVILRLAAVLGRHDPLTFALRLTRSLNPRLWKALEDVGIGRLIVQAGRERELANIYHANEAARRLSDEQYAAVLAFVRAGFDLAVQFHVPAPGPARG
jgi:transcriptional regulator with XRE-family HTH domain